MRSTRRSVRRRVTPRRKLIWARGSGSLVATSVAGGPPFAPPVQTDLLAPFETAYGAGLIGCTIVRVRGIMAVTDVATSQVVHGRATLHVGDQTDLTKPLVAADSAFAVESASLDSFMFEPFISPVDSAVVTPIVPGPSEVSARMIDVKSSRRLDELNQSLILRWSARSPAVQAAVPLTYDLSVLVALP